MIDYSILTGYVNSDVFIRTTAGTFVGNLTSNLRLENIYAANTVVGTYVSSLQLRLPGPSATYMHISNDHIVAIRRATAKDIEDHT